MTLGPICGSRSTDRPRPQEHACGDVLDPGSVSPPLGTRRVVLENVHALVALMGYAAFYGDDY
jgi:hypothetical protein